MAWTEFRKRFQHYRFADNAQEEATRQCSLGSIQVRHAVRAVRFLASLTAVGSALCSSVGVLEKPTPSVYAGVNSTFG